MHCVQGRKMAYDFALGSSRVFSVMYSLDSTTEFSKVAPEFKADAWRFEWSWFFLSLEVFVSKYHVKYLFCLRNLKIEFSKTCHKLHTSLFLILFRSRWRHNLFPLQCTDWRMAGNWRPTGWTRQMESDLLYVIRLKGLELIEECQLLLSNKK
jgi:hypothetical protein